MTIHIWRCRKTAKVTNCDQIEELHYKDPLQRFYRKYIIKLNEEETISNTNLKMFWPYCGLLLWLHGWSRSVNLERLAIYWPGCVFWAFLWLFPALKLKPHSTEAKYAPLVLIFHVAIIVVFQAIKMQLSKDCWSF